MHIELLTQISFATSSEMLLMKNRCAHQNKDHLSMGAKYLTNKERKKTDKNRKHIHRKKSLKIGTNYS